MSGDVLLSHTVSSAVPSALKGLTSGFGMLPGVSPSPWSPKLYGDIKQALAATEDRRDADLVLPGSRSYLGNLTVDAVDLCKKQALGLLVPVSSMCCHTSTSGLSTQWSAGGLTWLTSGKPHLETCFPLRCFQRLSLPNVANQPCSWQNNWHTRGSSTPVLSY